MFRTQIDLISNRQDIKEIRIEGLKIFITFQDGIICEYAYEFKNNYSKGDNKGEKC
jgi:hypothetical protein